MKEIQTFAKQYQKEMGWEISANTFTTFFKVMLLDD
jgi:hypothetical protein